MALNLISLKTGQVIALTAAGLIAYNLISKQKASDTLNYYPVGFPSIRFDGVTPILTLGLAAQNVSNQRFTIRSLAANLIANGFLVGNVSYWLPQVIEPRSQSVLTLEIRLSLLAVVNDIINAVSTGEISQMVTLKGWVNVDGFQAALNMTYKLGK